MAMSMSSLSLAMAEHTILDSKPFQVPLSAGTSSFSSALTIKPT
jgi:hypothetical protein